MFIRIISEDAEKMCILSNGGVTDHTKYLRYFCCILKGITKNEKIQFLLSCPMNNGNNISVTETMLPVIKNCYG
jgi:hypothetical protein